MENQSTIMCDKISVSSSTSSNKVRSSSDSLLAVSDSKHGRSKAQLCLQKIIAVILSGSCQKEKKFEDNHEKKKKGFGFDLNLSLDTNDDNWFSNDSSNVEFTSGSILVGNGESECDLKGVDVIEVEEVEEERRELSEVTDSRTPEIEEKGDVEMEEMVAEKSDIRKMGEEGYMDLLVEAARLVSGDFKEDESHETNEKVEETENRDEKTELKRRRSKRNIKLDVYEDFEDISPVVKSKRGRNQVLPLKYRDSVLDPWKPTTSMRSFKRVSNRNRN